MNVTDTRKTHAPAGLWVQIGVGGTLGLCVGTLMGMTTAPVVGTVVGALAALFATVFGVKDRDLSSFGRIGGFGVLCVLGVVAGIYLRAHNSLGISAGQQVTEWTTAGFNQDTARAIVLYKELGLLVNPNGELSATVRGEKVDTSSVLKTTLSSRSAGECAGMAPSQYGDDPVRVVSSYKAAGGEWEMFANALEGLSPAVQAKLVQAAYDLRCGTTAGK